MNCVELLAAVLQLRQHVHDGDVRTAVERAPQRTDAGRDGGIQVGLRRADHAHGRRGAVLLVVGVQQQQLVERADGDIVGLIQLVRLREHHVQQVGRVPELVARVVDRPANGLAVACGGDCSDLAHEPGRRLHEVVAVLGQHERRLEATQGVDHGRKDRHRRRVRGEAVEVMQHVLVDVLVGAQQAPELRELRRRRQLAEDQEVRRLYEARPFGQIFDGIAAIAEDAFLAVDEGDLALAGARVAVAAIECDEPGFGAQLRDIDGRLGFRADNDRHFIALAVVTQSSVLGHEESPNRAGILRSGSF